MNRILDIGHNDLRLFLRKKSAYVWLFVMPMAFVYFMSFINREANDPSNRPHTDTQPQSRPRHQSGKAPAQTH